MSVRPDLDDWIRRPTLRVAYQRESRADPDALWEAAGSVRTSDTGLLGRLIRLRIPGVAASVSFDDLFRHPPFTVLEEGERFLVSGLVGRIWTLPAALQRASASARLSRRWATRRMGAGSQSSRSGVTDRLACARDGG